MLDKVGWFVVALLLSVAPCVADTQTLASPVSEDEYSVYATALDLLVTESKMASHPVIAEQTSTFGCGADRGCNGLEIDGCNGLRGRNESPTERLEIVRRDLPGVTVTTTRDFESKNQQCSRLEQKIPAKVQYFLFGLSNAPKLPAGWEHPDYIYFSRVGFNADHTQALIYVAFMSGTNGHDSAGAYFAFLKQEGKWKAYGVSDVWQLTP